MNYAAEDLLRQIPLHNAHSSYLPQALRKLELSPITLPEPTVADQHLQAWIEECDQLLQAIETRQHQTVQFDTWFEETCLSKRPPGMTTGGVLSPGKPKRDGQ
ncbi:LANO_0E16204g1_1 [Lachancea nothofagi CBS 11611]|uniref:LANO_0E16204g1_1 n=1 Tax=Lachancea nothofagi CBS 11611 TaxID=1266666 RepID=A0A1G4K1R7_9SACH|nr:LANO_0E16204g1_1 [Lachancea nothofagi CBS 11611]